MIRVASYNIHRGIGGDGQYRPSRIAAVIDELEADVVALQEVDWHTHPEDARPQHVYFSLASGMTAIEGPNLRDHRGHYGNVLLTRLPVVEVRRIDLSVPGFEPRGAIVARLDAGADLLEVVATHLGRRARERREQVRRLLAALSGSGGGEDASVLTGDFNDWLPFSRSLARILASFGPWRSPRTFPAHRPLFPLDRIFVRPRRRLARLAVHASALARVASDHLPITATIAPPDESGGESGDPGGERRP